MFYYNWSRFVVNIWWFLSVYFRRINIQFERDSVAKGPGFSKFFLSRDRCVCHKPFHVSIMNFCVGTKLWVYKLMSKITDVKTNVQCIPQLCMFRFAHTYCFEWCGQLSKSSESNWLSQVRDPESCSWHRDLLQEWPALITAHAIPGTWGRRHTLYLPSHQVRHSEA